MYGEDKAPCWFNILMLKGARQSHLWHLLHLQLCYWKFAQIWKMNDGKYLQRDSWKKIVFLLVISFVMLAFSE